MKRKRKYTRELLQGVIAKSKSWSEACRYLGLAPLTGSQTHLKKRTIDYGIKYDHFTGQAHNKGKTWVLARAETYLFNGSIINSHRLKEYLFRDGIKEKKCEECKIKEWLGEECVFELDHIDNDHANNELSNLKIVCPNCHAIKTRRERKRPVRKIGKSA